MTFSKKKCNASHSSFNSTMRSREINVFLKTSWGKMEDIFHHPIQQNFTTIPFQIPWFLPSSFSATDTPVHRSWVLAVTPLLCSSRLFPRPPIPNPLPLIPPHSLQHTTCHLAPLTAPLLFTLFPPKPAQQIITFLGT